MHIFLFFKKFIFLYWTHEKNISVKYFFLLYISKKVTSDGGAKIISTLHNSFYIKILISIQILTAHALLVSMFECNVYFAASSNGQCGGYSEFFLSTLLELIQRRVVTLVCIDFDIIHLFISCRSQNMMTNAKKMMDRFAES